MHKYICIDIYLFIYNGIMKHICYDTKWKRNETHTLGQKYKLHAVSKDPGEVSDSKTLNICTALCNNRRILVQEMTLYKNQKQPLEHSGWYQTIPTLMSLRPALSKLQKWGDWTKEKC